MGHRNRFCQQENDVEVDEEEKDWSQELSGCEAATG